MEAKRRLTSSNNTGSPELLVEEPRLQQETDCLDLDIGVLAFQLPSASNGPRLERERCHPSGRSRHPPAARPAAVNRTPSSDNAARKGLFSTRPEGPPGAAAAGRPLGPDGRQAQAAARKPRKHGRNSLSDNEERDFHTRKQESHKRAEPVPDPFAPDLKK